MPNPPVKPAMWRVPLLVILVQLPSQLWAADIAADAVQFETHVRPILKAHCWHCHGEEEEMKGSLDARLARSLLQGGDSGPAIEPGDHAHSLLYQRVAAGEMPPGEKKLTPSANRRARALDRPGCENCARGAGVAATGKHLQRRGTRSLVVPADPPAAVARSCRSPALGQTPIDAFLLAALEAKGLSFGPPADRRDTYPSPLL